jgi:hypothetical protein
MISTIWNILSQRDSLGNLCIARMVPDSRTWVPAKTCEYTCFRDPRRTVMAGRTLFFFGLADPRIGLFVCVPAWPIMFRDLRVIQRG